MKNKLLIPLCLLALSVQAKEKFPALAFSNIPESLKTGAHAVYRFDSTTIHAGNIDKIKLTRSYAVTILDEKGHQHAWLKEYYNNNIAINDIDAILLDAEGNEIQSLKNRDVRDFSSYGTSSVFNSDQRYKVFDFQHKRYPYTIVFKIDKTLKSAFFLPDWIVHNNTSTSVQSTYFKLVSDNAAAPVRFKEYQFPEQVNRTQDKDEKGLEHYTWYMAGLAALPEQPSSKVENYSAPNIQLSPTKFRLYGHEGQISSWKDFGLFIYQLNVDRDDLTEDKKQMVRSMVANEQDTYAKVQKLYSFMQQSTRYVADEYGISGWQTFDAKDVCRNGYGDCKGLVNYLKSLLKAADIKAYTTLVFAGEDDYFKLDRDFPANNFNHVILCVPQAQDTLWVECTSQDLPAGYLGTFTENRDVLITTEEGGFITRTPAYKQEHNYAVRIARMDLGAGSGNMQSIKINNRYFGPMQDDMSHFVKNKPAKEVKDMLNSKFVFPTYSIKNFSYKNEVDDKHIPNLLEELELDASGITTSTQKRTFINLAWMRNPMKDIFQVDARTLPIVLNESFAITDSITVAIPESMEIEAMPADKHIKHDFAEYTLHFIKEKQNLFMIRKFVQHEGVYDAKLYKEYQSMFNNIQDEKQDLQLVTLNKAS